MVEKEIPMKKFAGALLILVPIVFWITQYLRYECIGGHCKISLEWILVGFAGILLGMVLILMGDDKKPNFLPPKELPENK